MNCEHASCMHPHNIGYIAAFRMSSDGSFVSAMPAIGGSKIAGLTACVSAMLIPALFALVALCIHWQHSFAVRARRGGLEDGLTEDDAVEVELLAEEIEDQEGSERAQSNTRYRNGRRLLVPSARPSNALFLPVPSAHPLPVPSARPAALPVRSRIAAPDEETLADELGPEPEPEIPLKPRLVSQLF